MSTAGGYRIRAGGVVEELDEDELLTAARDGRIDADTPVSVRGGGFVPAGHLPALEGVFAGSEQHGADDPWEHFGVDGGDGDDGVLASFLDRVESGLSPSAPAEELPEIVSVEALDSPQVEPEPSAAGASPAELEAAALTPLALSPAASVGQPASASDPPGSDPRDPIVRFQDWMNQADDDEARRLLGHLGDPGVAPLPPPKLGRVGSSPLLRVGVPVGLAAVVLLGWWTWVQVVAGATYPPVEEVRARYSGEPTAPTAPDAPDRPTARQPAKRPAPDSLLVRARLLRDEMGERLVDFRTADELETAIFIDLANRGLKPRAVRLDVLRSRGGREGKPTLAHIHLKLRGIDVEPQEVAPAILDSLLQVAVLLGKYARYAGITFENVEVEFGPPTPLVRVITGRRLADVFTGVVDPATLLAASPSSPGTP